MADVILRKESTSELYAKASISSGPVSDCVVSYDPLTITESFQIATFSIKVQYRAYYHDNKIEWDWKIVGQPTITRDNSLSPTIKNWYDSHKNANSPNMFSDLNTEIESQLKEHEISQEKAIQKEIKRIYDQSPGIAVRSQVGANEIIAIFAAKRKMRSTPVTYTPITITGKIMIKPQILTAATKLDSAEMTYKSGAGTEIKTCATAQILLANTLDNFKFRLDNVVESTGDLDMSPYDWYDNVGSNTLTALSQNSASLQVRMDELRRRQSQSMVEYAQTVGNYLRYAQWLREWQNNQRTTIERQGDGWFKFGLSGNVQGVINAQVIIPFGEGGLYFNSAVLSLNLNVNQLASEIGIWQQYFARVREYENNYNLALAAYLAGLRGLIPPITSTTDLNLTPPENFGTELPGNPEINQSPGVPGTGGRDSIELDTNPDLSPFFPGIDPPFLNFPDLPPLGMNGGTNGFFKA